MNEYYINSIRMATRCDVNSRGRVMSTRWRRALKHANTEYEMVSCLGQMTSQTRSTSLSLILYDTRIKVLTVFRVSLKNL